jgi:hypothetical protein
MGFANPLCGKVEQEQILELQEGWVQILPSLSFVCYTHNSRPQPLLPWWWDKRRKAPAKTHTCHSWEALVTTTGTGCRLCHHTYRSLCTLQLPFGCTKHLEPLTSAALTGEAKIQLRNSAVSPPWTMCSPKEKETEGPFFPLAIWNCNCEVSSVFQRGKKLRTCCWPSVSFSLLFVWDVTPGKDIARNQCLKISFLEKLV